MSALDLCDPYKWYPYTYAVLEQEFWNKSLGAKNLLMVDV